jgi:hypothetical protein
MYLSRSQRNMPPINGWMVPDPLGQGFSPYTGMGNNPVNNIDPTGGYWDYMLVKSYASVRFVKSVSFWGDVVTYGWRTESYLTAIWYWIDEAGVGYGISSGRTGGGGGGGLSGNWTYSGGKWWNLPSSGWNGNISSGRYGPDKPPIRFFRKKSKPYYQLFLKAKMGHPVKLEGEYGGLVLNTINVSAHRPAEDITQQNGIGQFGNQDDQCIQWDYSRFQENSEDNPQDLPGWFEDIIQLLKSSFQKGHANWCDNRGNRRSCFAPSVPVMLQPPLKHELPIDDWRSSEGKASGDSIILDSILADHLLRRIICDKNRWNDSIQVINAARHGNADYIWGNQVH